MKSRSRNKHLADETLLLLDEVGLRSYQTRVAEAHLQQCSQCQQRRAALAKSDKTLRLIPQAVTGPEAARTRLEAALLTASPTGAVQWTWSRLRPRPVFVLQAVAAVALCCFAATYRQVSRPLQDLMAAYEDTGPRPDRTLTPGSAAALSVAEVCQRNDEDLDPPVSRDQQTAVFHAYRMDERAAQAYQVDYLINPQLGGDSSLRNLWPEPYHATVWNATAKDALETRLHGMVCNGQLDLAAAQQDLAEDWIAAYKKYFHTSRPVVTVTKAALSAER